MNNNCQVCKATMDEHWKSIQAEVRKTADLSVPLNKAFVERCIYCYKQMLELTENKDQKWYLEIMAIIERRFN
jgi:hypothetical protein